MKKIIYLIAVVAVFFTSCDPMTDIYNDIDNSQEAIQGEVEYTLTDDDYADLDLSYGNFSSVDDAKTIIPGFLADKYPVWGAGSLANVTFNLYKSNSVKNEEAYEVAAQDYTDLGYNYGNFSSPSDLNTFLTWKYPEANRGDLVELTYRYYVGGGVVEDRVTNVLLLDEWTATREFTNAEYSAMGRSYPNFSSKDDAKFKIGIYLKTLYPFAHAGDVITSLYNWRHKNDDDVYIIDKEIAPYTFDGANWNLIGSVIENSIKFGHNGTVWVPDNTINYTLTNADYTLVGNGNYYNFDVRSGKDEELESARVAKINTILLNNFPNAEEGQKYLVKYAVYSGAAEIWTTKVILTDGEYVKFEE